MPCDPRVTYCLPNQAWNADLMNYFFKGVCVLATTTFLACVGHSILSFSRRGMKLNLANQLTVYRTISSLFFAVGSFILAYQKSRDLSWFVELLHYLAYASAIGVNLTLASFLNKLRQLQRQNGLDQANIQNIFDWIERTPGICMVILTPMAVGAVVYARYESSTQNSYLIFMVPAMITQLAVVYLVSHHREISRNLVLKNVRVISKTVRNAFIFLCLVSMLDIFVSTLQLVLYHELLSSHSAVGWVILSSIKYLLYTIQVASLAGVLCNSDFSENGFNFLREVAVVELKAGTSEGAVMKKKGSSTETHSVNKAIPVCETVEVTVKLSAEMMWWNKPPKTFWDLFQFPNPINETDSKLHSCFTISYALVIMISDHWIGDMKPWYLFVPLVYGYTARLIAGTIIFPPNSLVQGPNLDPQAWLVVTVLSPLVSKLITPEYVPGPPKRFANFCGACVSWLSFILYLVNEKEACFYILCMLLILAILQASGMCLGCFFFHIMMIMKVVPPETCEICRVKFSTVDNFSEVNLPTMNTTTTV